MKIGEYIRTCFTKGKKAASFLFREEADIQKRLLNLVLLTAVFGGIVSLVISVIMKTSGNFITVLMIALLGICLWLINVKKRTQLGSILISVFVNLIFFPLMYFYEGGIHSGMPLWMLLGMLVSVLIIRGWVCYFMYILNAAVIGGCFYIEYYHPEFVEHLDQHTINLDVFQSVILVSCVFGVIFKYQSYVYEKQRKSLMLQDEQLRRSMEELKKANQAKSDFLANMSHEIRTPINAILGMNEMIIRKSGDEEIVKYALDVESASQNLLSLVNDILDFSKIESGKMELVLVRYDISSLIHDCYNMVIMRAREKNLTVRIENDNTLPSQLYGDEVRIRQIISNLLTNAVKYTTVGGVTLAVGWERLEGKEILLKIEVKDTGLGISKEDQEKLFFSFQRVDEKKNRNIEGTGLGLAITKQFIELMGGTIQVQSEYGKGSVFSLAIPQGIISEMPMGDFSQRFDMRLQNMQEYRESFIAPKARILVVDDVEMNLEVVKGLLKDTKIQIDTASSGEQCLDMIQEKKYHIIFMDHMMPVMDGIEAFHKMRERKGHPNVDTPVVVLTANAILGAEKEYLAQGFCAYLSKPIRSDKLEKITLRFLPPELVYRTKDMKSMDREETFLEKLSFLDTKDGLAYCAGDENLYRSVLVSSLDPARFSAVIEMYEKEDWHNYEIQVHAVKSISHTIGAKPLSMQAKKLEDAAREGNIDYIKRHNESFLRNYQEIYAKINAVMRSEKEKEDSKK